MIGRLKRRLTLEQELPSADGGGGYALAWTTVATTWAAIQPITGGEQLAAMQLASPVTHRVVIRYRPGVSAGMRAKLGARLFNIRAVIDRAESKRYLELLCEEGVAT